MRAQGAGLFIFAAAWGATLPACGGIGLEGLGPDPVEAGPVATGTTASGNGNGSGSGSATSAGDGGADATPPDATPPSQATDASRLDASDDVETDASAIDAPDEPHADAPVSTIDCDEDGDGFLAAGGTCHGNDCCDTDPAAHPGQAAYFTQADACGAFDYDCNGSLTPEYAQVGCSLGPSGCSGDGFMQPPACGATATFEHCSQALLSCVWTASTKAQGCR